MRRFLLEIITARVITGVSVLTGKEGHNYYADGPLEKPTFNFYRSKEINRSREELLKDC